MPLDLTTVSNEVGYLKKFLFCINLNKFTELIPFFVFKMIEFESYFFTVFILNKVMCLFSSVYDMPFY
jgi:hypothetical protein